MFHLQKEEIFSKVEVNYSCIQETERGREHPCRNQLHFLVLGFLLFFQITLGFVIVYYFRQRVLITFFVRNFNTIWKTILVVISFFNGVLTIQSCNFFSKLTSCYSVKLSIQSMMVFAFFQGRL